MVLTSTHNLCFEKKYEKYQNFLSENFHFLVVKLSVNLNRHVFVMSNSDVRMRKTLKRFLVMLGFFNILMLHQNNFFGHFGSKTRERYVYNGTPSTAVRLSKDRTRSQRQNYCVTCTKVTKCFFKSHATIQTT